MKKPELLAPAGSLGKLKYAIVYGADAVYIGGEAFSLRVAAKNFTNEEIKEGIEFAHKYGKKVYITANIIPHNADLEAFPDFVREVYEMGADAIIVSDPGTFSIVREVAPELEVHISTQANNTNYRSAQFWCNQGAKRIVLARDLDFNEIAQIKQKLPQGCEIECFVHGAMCISYSGRCLLSNYMTQRDANKGACAHPCRWKYYLMEEKRPGEYFALEETDSGSMILSSHDMCAIDLLEDLVAAGVCSFKIEGRMKSAYYVASVVNAYRKAMDGTLTREEARAELECLQHRPYSTGFYHGDLKLGHYNDGGYTSHCRVIANVLDWADGVATIRQRNHFRLGDRLELLSPHTGVESFVVESMVNEEGLPQTVAPHPMQVLRVPCPIPLHPGDMLRRREN